MMGVVIVLFVGAAAWAGTGLVRRYVLRKGILDVPNKRSSHRRPTATGGGVAIVLAVVAGTVLSWIAGIVDGRLAAAILGGGAPIATIGWIDDQSGVLRRHRAIVHVLGAAWAVALLGGFETVTVGVGSLDLGPAGAVLAVIGVAWLINLYNFMDGIDGLAGSEAVIAAGAGGILAVTAGASDVAVLAFLTATSAAGFLVWNWPPAKIFMGDVGSSFLGYVFGVLALASESTGSVPLLAWLVLLGVFVFDATATLLRRALRGEQWYRAHRSHAYQRAVQSGWSHRRVTGGIVVLNVALAGLAAVGVLYPQLLLAAAVSAALLLTSVYAMMERRLAPPPLHDAEPVEARS